MTKVGESEEDVDNIEAWAEIIKDVLRCAPIEKRAAILALATQNEADSAARRKANGDRLVVINAAELMANTDTPGLRHWNVIMRLKSLIVQVFVRNIRNNHSPKDAGKLLFVGHRYGTGSGLLADYLDDLSRGDDDRQA